MALFWPILNAHFLFFVKIFTKLIKDELSKAGKSLPFKMSPMANKRQIAHSDEIAPKLMCISNDLTNYHISKSQSVCSGQFSLRLRNE